MSQNNVHLNLSIDSYQIMLDCWSEDPNSRPTFDRLHEITTENLQDEVCYTS